MIGLAGTFAHRAQPSARIDEFFDVNFGAYPSVLYFGWAYLWALLRVSADVAFSIFIALFCIAAPPVALLCLLRALGRPRYLALLAFPIGYHQQIWFGFLGSSASVAGLVFALAFAIDAAYRPRLGNHLALACAVLFLAMAHPFSLALAFLVLLPFLVWPPGRSVSPERGRVATTALRLACFVPALVFLTPWLAGFIGRSVGSANTNPAHTPFVARALHEFALDRPRPHFDGSLFVNWLGNGYQSHQDELIPGVALLVLVSFVLLGARPEQSKRRVTVACPADAGLSHAWIWLAWAVAVLAAGFLLLPQQVFWPERWWGVRVRCVVPLFLVLVATIRPTPRGLPAWLVAPSVAAALMFAGYLTWDFRAYWHNQVLSGFREAIAAVPPGQSLLSLTVFPEPHYTVGHPYLAQHYVAWQGGRAVPYQMGHPGSYWVTQKLPPPAPPWGDPALFVWAEHGAGYDYFLVELPVTGTSNDPLHALAAQAAGPVTLVKAAGQWRVYRRK